jgi:ubiquinone/menaquinone biosynthesis C-methylase UbiE
MHTSVVNDMRLLTAFDAVADSYDEVFTNSRIGQAQRALVWQEMDRVFQPGQRVLEINCGTGVDALHLAERGVELVACDSSLQMIQQAERRLASTQYGRKVDLRVLATEEISQIQHEAPFDGVLSNFAGLNCVEDLRAAGASLARLLKSGSKALLCIFGRWCAWEIAWSLAHGNCRKAFRRLKSDGVIVRLNSTTRFRVRYPTVRRMKALFAPNFRLVRWRGVGVSVPPSSLRFLSERFPVVMRAAANADVVLGRVPIVRCLSDHILLTFERV